MQTTYRFTLGNTNARKGHRQDCAHICVVLEVEADSLQEAEARLRSGEGKLLGYELGGALPKGTIGRQTLREVSRG